jgi:hypothetical protein
MGEGQGEVDDPLSHPMGEGRGEGDDSLSHPMGEGQGEGALTFAMSETVFM